MCVYGFQRCGVRGGRFRIDQFALTGGTIQRFKTTAEFDRGIKLSVIFLALLLVTKHFD